MSQFPGRLYEFGQFRLDGAERVLWRGDELIVLPPKVFDTLLMLVDKEGSVVSKSELMEAIWADAFVEESNLSQNIYTLRRTLGADEQGRQFIETVPRRGYRFAVPVKPVKTFQAVAKQTQEVVQDHLITTSQSVSRGHDSTGALSLSTRESPPEDLQPAFVPATTRARTHSAVRNAFFAGLGVLIASALAMGIYQLVIRRSDRVAPIEQLRVQRLTDSGDVDSPTISPSGELLAYVRFEEEGESVWVEQIASGSSFQTLTSSPKGYRSLAFSPDGKYLFFRDGADPGTIYQTFPYGGAPRIVADNVWSDFSVSPDGKQVAFIRSDTSRDSQLLTVANIDGSGEREVTTRETRLASLSNAPAWSPDSAKVVVAKSGGTLLAVTLATGEETELRTPSWRSIFNTVWMP